MEFDDVDNNVDEDEDKEPVNYKEKISFLTPFSPTDEHPLGHKLQSPKLTMKPGDRIGVTVGVVGIDLDYIYTVNVDIYFDDKLLTDHDINVEHFSNRYEVSGTGFNTTTFEFEFPEYLELHDEGLYRISCVLYRNHENRDPNYDLEALEEVTKSDTFFYVSDDWYL
ncbi:hypothetical protein [Serratia plymuthica]|uniref:hypothetical protein n=1 Tax=Serratia plymuthica TaxID=82996 RepID=UPI00093623EC|nr:hypothetical protein [Serratia plymuthica]OJT42889.1 hypothetical protein BSR04_08060 [Serratia plymuthica]